MYRVIYSFADLTDKQHIYKVGDEFPHKGLSVSEERLKELSTSANKIGIPLIKEDASTDDEADGQLMPDMPMSEATDVAAKPKKGKKKADASTD